MSKGNKGIEAQGAEVRVYRHSANERFVIVENDMARNRMSGVKLTSVARCVLIHLLSLPQGWKTNRDRLAEDFTEGRDRVGKALNELVDTGFLLRERINDPETGRLVWIWAVSDEPWTFTQVATIDGISVDGDAAVADEPQTPRSQPSTENQAMEIQSMDSQSMVTSIYEERTLSIEESERGNSPALPAAAEWATSLIAGLEFGRHRRPNRREVAELGALVEAACSEYGLSEIEVRRHCRAALNSARTNGVAYLRGALAPDRLPVPRPVEAGPVAAGPAPRPMVVTTTGQGPRTPDPEIRAKALAAARSKGVHAASTVARDALGRRKNSPKSPQEALGVDTPAPC